MRYNSFSCVFNCQFIYRKNYLFHNYNNMPHKQSKERECKCVNAYVSFCKFFSTRTSIKALNKNPGYQPTYLLQSFCLIFLIFLPFIHVYAQEKNLKTIKIYKNLYINFYTYIYGTQMHFACRQICRYKFVKP